MDNENKIMATSFAGLSLADYLTTKKIIKDGGVEYNPIARFFIKKKLFGVFKFIATTIGVIGICCDSKDSKLSKFLLGLYGLVVTNNVTQIIKHRKDKE